MGSEKSHFESSVPWRSGLCSSIVSTCRDCGWEIKSLQGVVENFLVKSNQPIPWRDSISRPIAPISSVERFELPSYASGVTRLVKFSPVVQLIALVSFSKISEAAPIRETTFFQNLCINFSRKILDYILGDLITNCVSPRNRIDLFSSRVWRQRQQVPGDVPRSGGVF
jgi:hypothetical protein